MAKLRRQNIFNTTTAVIKFIAFWIMVVIQVPIIAFLPRHWAVRYMPVFMWFLLKLGGIKIVVHGKLSDARPLMIVSNHISVFELATFPCVFHGSFIAKKEMENWPLVGWVAKKFGVIFVDRRPSHAQPRGRCKVRCRSRPSPTRGPSWRGSSGQTPSPSRA